MLQKGSEEQAGALSWTAQSCAPQPVHGGVWPVCLSQATNPELIQWLLLRLVLVQSRGERLSFLEEVTWFSRLWSHQHQPLGDAPRPISCRFLLCSFCRCFPYSDRKQPRISYCEEQGTWQISKAAMCGWAERALFNPPLCFYIYLYMGNIYIYKLWQWWSCGLFCSGSLGEEPTVGEDVLSSLRWLL